MKPKRLSNALSPALRGLVINPINDRVTNVADDIFAVRFSDEDRPSFTNLATEVCSCNIPFPCRHYWIARRERKVLRKRFGCRIPDSDTQARIVIRNAYHKIVSGRLC